MEDTVGQRIANNKGGRDTEWQIMGVVADVREGPLDAVGVVQE